MNMSAQTVEIQYKYHELLKPKNLPRDEIHRLINVNDEFSYYVVEKEQDHSNNPGYTPPSESEALRAYKKFDQDSIYTVYPLGFRYVYVKEKMPQIQWHIEKETKAILGYDCKKATTVYRGRKYEAYFTDKIPTTDGPWKFSGLPGTILEIYDTEKKLTIEAIGIKILKEEKDCNHYLAPLKVKKIHTYDDFVRLSIATYSRILAAMNSSLSNSSDAVTTANFIKNYPQMIEIINVEKYR